MGKKSYALTEQFSNAYTELDGRLSRLERLARQIQNGQAPAAQAESTAVRSGTVDYGAIAFGLSEIKKNVSALISSGVNIDTTRAQREYQGAVDYFADVFAKADPGFNRTEFNSAAGR